MPAKIDKAIITNLTAMKAKYGVGFAPIDKELKNLIEADKKRGLNTSVIDISNSRTMAAHKGKAVTNMGTPRQVKAAIDAIYKRLAPGYLMILGSVDIIPHQDIKNPVFHPDADDDEFAPGDIPYACDHPYSQNPADFISPTRVIGRLPDVTGEKNPEYLSGLLKTAATYQSRASIDYQTYLGISASVWDKSTRQSLQKTFGTGSGLNLSPPSGPDWPLEQFRLLSHFINCHGAPADPHFYGQKEDQYPISHDATKVAKKASEGTVVAAECCYGAELYPPSKAGGLIGMCNSYLLAKAYGFFGSSTIAYGPAEGNANADLICQYFFSRLLGGASLGRAVLQARQDFIRSAAVLDPYDLKTLAQFNLMGDPAVHPVQVNQVDHPFEGMIQSKGFLNQRFLGTMGMARERLNRYGLAIGSVAATAQRSDDQIIPSKVHKAISLIASNFGTKPVGFHAHTVKDSSSSPISKTLLKSTKGLLGRSAPKKIYIGHAVLPSRFLGENKKPGRPLAAIVARESDEGLLFRALFSR